MHTRNTHTHTRRQRFVERFGIQQIGEFYGATEGNIVFFNFWSPREPSGAIGALRALPVRPPA